MKSLYDRTVESAKYLKGKVDYKPYIAVVLGSGLDKFVDMIQNKIIIPYEEIPNFPKTTVKGHNGNLIFGKIGDINVVVMEGRFHFYEGHNMEMVSYPYYVLKQIGVEKIILTNASGGINENFQAGDLMIITDFINNMGSNPLIGDNDERFGTRFPDMTEPYNLEMIDELKKVGNKLGVNYKEGVYLGTTGPSFESKAEIKAFGILGADAVGMSTVPETIVCNYLGMKVLGVSCITNMGTGIQKVKHDHNEVLKIANASSDIMCNWIRAYIEEKVG